MCCLTFGNFTKNSVLAIEPGSIRGTNEELRAVMKGSDECKFMYINMDKKQEREFGKTYPLVLGPALAIDNVPAPPILKIIMHSQRD